MTDPRRLIPRTDAVLADERLVRAAGLYGYPMVRSAVRDAQQRARRGELPPTDVADAALAGLPAPPRPPVAVLNATGVIVHTNLGRAPLSQAARAALALAAGYTDVEFDLDTGRRARRGRATMSALAAAVPRAGSVHVVNNNAAALLLCALALAAGREVIVSRGELVEIGDGFRIPELLESGGARLREVGTTNRTHLDDYAHAVGPQTGFILKVHTSNFQVVGFTAAVPVDQLARLGPPVVADIGSGLLRPHPLLPGEPDADSTLAAGAAVVTASGDKLLGGPQAGLLLGTAPIIELLRRHPAARAVRADKLTLAALNATLTGPEPPVAAALSMPLPQLRHRADRLATRLCTAGVDARVEATGSAVGGGSAPEVTLPSAAISLPAGYGAALRGGHPPVVGRVEADRCLLDLRTVDPVDDDRLLGCVLAVAACQAA